VTHTRLLQDCIHTMCTCINSTSTNEYICVHACMYKTSIQNIHGSLNGGRGGEGGKKFEKDQSLIKRPKFEKKIRISQKKLITAIIVVYDK
jgi:hypothetical protein